MTDAEDLREALELLAAGPSVSDLQEMLESVAVAFSRSVEGSVEADRLSRAKRLLRLCLEAQHRMPPV